MNAVGLPVGPLASRLLRDNMYGYEGVPLCLSRRPGPLPCWPLSREDRVCI